MNKNCYVCMMPFAKDTGARGSEKYCSYRYKDGKVLADDMNLDEFKANSCVAMVETDMPWIIARFYTWTIGFSHIGKREKHTKVSTKTHSKRVFV